MKSLVYGTRVIGGQLAHAPCATERFRQASAEMKNPGAAFQRFRAAAPDCRLPCFDKLRAMMPPWEQIRKTDWLQKT